MPAYIADKIPLRMSPVLLPPKVTDNVFARDTQVRPAEHHSLDGAVAD